MCCRPLATFAVSVSVLLSCSQPPGAERSAPSASASAGSSGPAMAASARPALSNSASSTAPVASAPSSTEPEESGPRIYSKARHAWVHYQPSAKSGWIGWLGLADSVRLKSDKPVAGDGCARFYAVEPRGYVCLDQRTTLDPQDPGYQALKRWAPRTKTPFPHFYGESKGAPRYYSIPTAKQQRQKEYNLDEHLKALQDLRDGKFEEGKIPPLLQGVDPKPAGHGPEEMLKNIPPRTYEERDYIGPGSAIAWTEEFDAEGRTWLVTPDFAFMPKDKIKVYPRVSFQGVKLEGDTKLPLAFLRKKARPQYARKDDTLVATGAEWPKFSTVLLTGEKIQQGDKVYYATRDNLYILKEDATLVRPTPRTPWGTAVEGATAEGAAMTVGLATPPGGRKTWVEVSVLGGWMIAYEDTKPIFATLIAPGRGGVPTKGIDPIETASTPVGAYRVDGKFYTGTMVNKAWVHADVPFVLNFHGPHALHMAYWHDTWGEKTSGGCINLSPQDALWFFQWTDPPVPSGWHGTRSDKEAGPATLVIIHS